MTPTLPVNETTIKDTPKKGSDLLAQVQCTASCSERATSGSHWHWCHWKRSNHRGSAIHKSPLQSNVDPPFPIQHLCSMFLWIPARRPTMRWTAKQGDKQLKGPNGLEAALNVQLETRQPDVCLHSFGNLTYQNRTDCKWRRHSQ